MNLVVVRNICSGLHKRWTINAFRMNFTLSDARCTEYINNAKYFTPQTFFLPTLVGFIRCMFKFELKLRI